jgi:hypothetical protein
MAASASASAALLLRLALVAAAALALASPASAQLPNFRMALPPDVDPEKKMDVQAGYELLSRSEHLRSCFSPPHLIAARSNAPAPSEIPHRAPPPKKKQQAARRALWRALQGLIPLLRRALGAAALQEQAGVQG